MARSLLSFVGPRDPCPLWLARFRETEPTAELVDLGNGFWALGSFRPDYRAFVVGIKTLDSHLRRPDWAVRPSALRAARARMEGFRPITLYEDRELFDGSAFDDFRERDWRWRNLGDEAFLDNAEAKIRFQEANEATRQKEHRLMARELAPWLVANRMPGLVVPANLN